MSEELEASPARAPDPRPRGIAWFSPPALRLHGVAVLGVTACVVATRIEWSRAVGGHGIAWVYSFEWPIFAIMGTYLWWKLLMATAPEGASRLRAPSQAASTAVVDPELEAWRAYLRRLHATDPPGGPS